MRVSADTTWIFLELRCGDIHGIGEASLLGHDAGVVAVAQRDADYVLGHSVTDTEALFSKLSFGNIIEAAFSSALMQAAWDIKARLDDMSVSTALGGTHRSAIPAYANINRATVDRTPAGFAATAASALGRGYTAFKIAPFDEVTPELAPAAMGANAAAGIARVAAVRDAIGPDQRLMVDCHWRFSEAGALDLVDALKPFDLHWLECPMVENGETLEAIRGIRARANAAGMQLAGCEKAVLGAGLTPFLEAGAYDAMMPDVKYAGGPDEMLRIEAQLRRYGVEFSPHNPTGPVCHVASAQVCAALPHSGLLEMQFEETVLFDELVGNALPPVVDGEVRLDAATRGYGIELNEDCMQSLEQTAGWSSDRLR